MVLKSNEQDLRGHGNEEVAQGRDTSRLRRGLVVPSATVFVASLCIMVLELTAGRLIASYVGFSLYTWTSVIGTVLTGIAFGSWFGGRVADRFRPRQASYVRCQDPLTTELHAAASFG